MWHYFLDRGLRRNETNSGPNPRVGRGTADLNKSQTRARVSLISMKPNFCRSRKWRSFSTNVDLPFTGRGGGAIGARGESHFHRFSINHTPRLQIMMFSRRVTQSRSRGEALNYGGGGEGGEQCRVKRIMIPGGARTAREQIISHCGKRVVFCAVVFSNRISLCSPRWQALR